MNNLTPFNNVDLAFFGKRTSFEGIEYSRSVSMTPSEVSGIFINLDDDNESVHDIFWEKMPQPKMDKF